MNKWTRLQDKIASHRLLIGFLILMFSCIFFVFFLRIETNFRIYFKYITQGIVTDFETIQQEGVANHHLQYAELEGWMRYDFPMDFLSEKKSHCITTDFVRRSHNTICNYCRNSIRVQLWQGRIHKIFQALLEKWTTKCMKFSTEMLVHPLMK